VERTVMTTLLTSGLLSQMYSKEQNKIWLLVGFWRNQALRVVLSVVPNWVGVSILFCLRTGSDPRPEVVCFVLKMGRWTKCKNRVMRSGSYLWFSLAITVSWDLLKLFFPWKSGC